MNNDRDREQDLHDRVVTAIGQGGLNALRDAGLAVVCLDELEKHLAELREERNLIDAGRGVREVLEMFRSWGLTDGDEEALLREILTRLGVKANRDDITTLGARDHLAVATGEGFETP